MLLIAVHQGVIMLDSSSDHDDDASDEGPDDEAGNETPFSDEATPLVGERRYTVSPWLCIPQDACLCILSS